MLYIEYENIIWRILINILYGVIDNFVNKLILNNVKI